MYKCCTFFLLFIFSLAAQAQPKLPFAPRPDHFGLAARLGYDSIAQRRCGPFAGTPAERKDTCLTYGSRTGAAEEGSDIPPPPPPVPEPGMIKRYDARKRVIYFGEDSIGRASFFMKYEYDAQGRIRRLVKNSEWEGYQTTRYIYDAQGRLISQVKTHYGGRFMDSTSFIYGEKGLALQQRFDGKNKNDLAKTHTITWNYRSDGLLESETEWNHERTVTNAYFYFKRKKNGKK